MSHNLRTRGKGKKRSLHVFTKFGKDAKSFVNGEGIPQVPGQRRRELKPSPGARKSGLCRQRVAKHRAPCGQADALAFAPLPSPSLAPSPLQIRGLRMGVGEQQQAEASGTHCPGFTETRSGAAESPSCPEGPYSWGPRLSPPGSLLVTWAPFFPLWVLPPSYPVRDF